MNTSTLQILIQRLNTLAQTFQHTHIHIDTMLHTTTEIYENLIHIKSNGDNTSGENPSALPTILPNAFNQYIQNDDTQDNDMNKELDALFNGEYDKTIGATEEIIENVQKATQTTQTIIKEDGIQLDLSGINIEFPPTTVYKKVEVMEQNSPSNNADEVTETSDNSLNEAPQLPNKEPIITGQEFKVPTLQNHKDFKNEIGFNDRYLFMNELFQNNKDLFDATIAKINNSKNLNSAKTLISQEVGTPHKWDENNTTVQIFYGLLEKYFKTR
jgi:hypothetical protein